MANVEATVLIGLSSAGAPFKEPMLREMARKTDLPIIFPLSNPTVKAEATAEDVIRWSIAILCSVGGFLVTWSAGRTAPRTTPAVP